MKKSLIIFFCITLLFLSQSNAQIITTFAGNGTAGYYGNGGQATAAELDIPFGLGIDSSGNIYVSDSYNSVVRVINTSGIISNFAGNGVSAYSGDGGPATNASFIQPFGIALDSAGNIYISDHSAFVIRKVNTAGIITTIAGIGHNGYSGDGGPATAAELRQPAGMICDNKGNLFFADATNNRIRKINAAGIITTIAGNGIAGYYGDGGQATAAEIDNANYVAEDTAGNLYITDKLNYRIRKIDTSGIITTVAGIGIAGYSGDGGQATAAEIDTATSVKLDSIGNIYIADSYSNRIRKINTSGIISTIAGTGVAGYSGDGGPATAAVLNLPGYLMFDHSGNLYFPEHGNNVVREIHFSLSLITSTKNASCTGGNGSAYVTANYGIPPYTYSWSGPGSTNDSITGLSAGTYTVHVTDSKNISGSSIVTINPSNSLSISANTTTNVSCNGGNDGSASSNANGGTPPYSYLWSDANSQITASAISLSAATYTVSVTDFCSNTATASVTITQPNALGISPSATNNVNCYGGTNGSASANASGGTIPYSYLWSDASSQISASATDLSAGTYTVTVTDNCNNTTTASVTITQPAVLNVVATATDSTICSGLCTNLFANVSGGTLPYTYLWGTGDTSSSINVCPTITTPYPIGISDAHGCLSGSSVTININICTGITELQFNNSIEVYPNPTNDILNIQMPQPMDGTLSITNVLGQQVYAGIMANNSSLTQVSMGSLSQGVYLLKIESAQQTVVKRIVKL